MIDATRRHPTGTILLVSVIALFLVAFIAPVTSQSPILYITTHGGKHGNNNINSYSWDGQLLHENILEGDDDANELRSGLILPNGTMLLANAHKSDSRIALYSNCDSNGKRQYIDDWSADHLAHPYGIVGGLNAASGENVYWVTNQDTYDIVQFNQFGVFQRQVKAFSGGDELRSLAYDTETNVLFIADEDANAVLAYDTRIGAFNSSLGFSSVNTPIGLFIDAVTRTIFIGSNGDPSAVYAYNLDSHQLIQTFTNSNLVHPAGMVSVGDQLLVLSQKTSQLLQFDIGTGKLTGIPIQSFDDTPEQIFLSNC